MLTNYDLARVVSLVHHHGGNESYPMYEVDAPPLDAASDDPEQAWHGGARIFRCSACDHQVAIGLQSEADARESIDRLG